jgi:hypothetical protein
MKVVTDSVSVELSPCCRVYSGDVPTRLAWLLLLAAPSCEGSFDPSALGFATSFRHATVSPQDTSMIPFAIVTGPVQILSELSSAGTSVRWSPVTSFWCLSLHHTVRHGRGLVPQDYRNPFTRILANRWTSSSWQVGARNYDWDSLASVFGI